LEVCGATMTTIFGRAGKSPSRRQPSAPKRLRPTTLEKVFPRLGRQSGSAGILT